jgi:uridine kinase
MKRAFARIVGIAGGTGSGKTWLAHFLKAELGPGATLISQDWYYKDQSAAGRAKCATLNFDHPRAIETSLLVGHLDQLRQGRPVQTPRYDFATHTRIPRAISLDPAPVLIVEGLFVLHQKSIFNRLDHSVFVDVPADVRLMRRLRRDVAERSIPAQETLRLYETFARPMHERFVEPSAAWARHVWRPLCEHDFPARFASEIKELLLP